jgi:hypothetical protein
MILLNFIPLYNNYLYPCNLCSWRAAPLQSCNFFLMAQYTIKVHTRMMYPALHTQLGFTADSTAGHCVFFIYETLFKS